MLDIPSTTSVALHHKACSVRLWPGDSHGCHSMVESQVRCRNVDQRLISPRSHNVDHTDISEVISHQVPQSAWPAVADLHHSGLTHTGHGKNAKHNNFLPAFTVEGSSPCHSYCWLLGRLVPRTMGPATCHRTVPVLVATLWWQWQ